MAGDKIGYNDAFDSGADFFDPLIKGLEKVYAGFDKMGQKATENLLPLKEYFSTFKAQTATSADIKEFNAALTQQSKAVTDLNTANKAKLATTKELEKLEQERQKTQQQSIKTEIEYQKLQKISNTERKKTLDAYQKESKVLNDLRNKYKAVAVEQGINSVAAQNLLAKITPLDKKLKQIDATAGQFQRSVGNYSSAFDKFGSSVNNILGAAGISVGIGGFISFAKSIFNTRAEFQKFEAVLTNTLGSQSQAQAALDNISSFAAKTPFGVAEVTESFVKLANRGFKPTNAELTKLGDLAASQGKSFGQLTEAILDAQTGEFERLKEFGVKATQANGKVTLSFKDQTVVVNKNDEAIRNAILGFGELQGVAGGMAAISDTLGGKLSNLNDNFDALLNNLGESSQGVFAAFLDGLNDLLGSLNEYDKKINEINRNLKSEGVKLGFFDRISETTSKANIALQSQINVVKELSTTTKDYASGIGKLQEAQAEILGLYKSGQLTVDQYASKSALLRKGIKDLTEASKAYTTDLDKEHEKLNRNTKATEKNTKAKKDNKSTGTFDEAIAAQNEELRKDQEEQDYEYAKRKKEREAQENEEEYQAAIKLQEDLLKLDEEALAAEEKARKEAREKERKELFDNANKVIDIVEDRIKREQELVNDAIDSEIDKRTAAVDEQKRRAEQGLTNTLAFEEQALKEAEARKAEEEKKAVKREKTISFFKLLSANAEKDPNNAIQKTLTEMLLADSIAQAFFFKGTEKVSDDLKGNPNKRDGYIVAVDGSERVLTGEQNKLIGDMSNEELANLAYQHNNKVLPNYIINEPVSNPSFANNVYDSIHLQKLVKQNEELINAVKNIPGTKVLFEKGFMSTTKTQNGYSVTTKKSLNGDYN